MYRPHNRGLELASTKVGTSKPNNIYLRTSLQRRRRALITAAGDYCAVVIERTPNIMHNEAPSRVYYWYRRRTDLCVKETVTFTNNGSSPVRVSWMPSADNAGAAVGVAPRSFEIVDRAEISVQVEPLRPGSRLRETLRFSAENRDGATGETVLYVRGTVEQGPEVRVRPAMAPLGSVYAGTLESYHVEFEVTSDGPFHVQRCLYAFDTDDGELSLRGDAKSFGPYGNGNTTAMQQMATLNFKTPIETKVSGKCMEKTAARSGNGLNGQLVRNYTTWLQNFNAGINLIIRWRGEEKQK